MKLQELATPKNSRQMSSLFESYFENQVAFDRLTRKQAGTMLSRVRSLIKEHRSTTQRHRSERNPAYLKLVMMEQALVGRLEETTPLPVTTGTSTATASTQPKFNPKDPKVVAAIKKSQQPGAALTPDEDSLVKAAAAATQAQTEGRLRRAYGMLKESEVQQAQVVLAAQEMVDSMQGMIEDSTEMQYKELPALVDSIRNQVGVEQANQFNTDVTAALTGLVQNLQGAKQQLETALGVVTGQAQPAPALDAAMGADADQGDMDLGGEPMPDLDNMPAEPPADLDTKPAGTPGALGRERR